MQFQKGKPRPANAGRKKGSINRYSRELARKIEELGAMSPLDFFLCVVHDETVSVEARLLAARSAAPYVHRKKPIALEVTGKFEFLSPEEREMRRQLLLEEIRSRATQRANVEGN